MDGLLLDRTPLSASGDDNPRMSLCHKVSEALPGDYVWVYGQDDKGDYKGNNFVGDDFPKPKDSTIEGFDAQAAKSYGEIPTRSAIPDTLAGKQLVGARLAPTSGVRRGAPPALR